MKRFHNPLLSLAAPLLILVSLLIFFQKENTDKLQCLPSFVVGFGLIATGYLQRSNRRKKLLSEMRRDN